MRRRASSLALVLIVCTSTLPFNSKTSFPVRGLLASASCASKASGPKSKRSLKLDTRDSPAAKAAHSDPVPLASLPVADNENRECYVIVQHVCKSFSPLPSHSRTQVSHSSPPLRPSHIETSRVVRRAVASVSGWVPNMIVSGYMLHFAHRSPRYNVMVASEI